MFIDKHSLLSLPSLIGYHAICLPEQTFGAGSPFLMQPSTVIDRRIVA